MMTTDSAKVAAIADALYAAETSKAAIAPLVQTWPGMILAESYAVQMHNISRALGTGRTISGKKIGLTSKAMQDLLKVDQPDFGHLFSDMEAKSGRIPMSSMLQPRAEGEIAFVLARDLDMAGDITVQDVIASTEYVTAAIEIVDSRIADWKIGLLDTVADNASSGMYVLGTKKVDPKSFDLVGETMDLFVNGQKRNSGTGAAVLGNPAFCVAWLANTMRHYGTLLRKGEVILSGALSAMVAVKAGDTVRADFGMLGTVSVEFL